MSNHTPGPWKLNGWDVVQQGCTDAFPALAAILNADGSVCMEEINANARLIAAAPELLHELKRLCEECDSIGWNCDYAKKAIRKAEGGEG